jgi:hypothetical protein
MRLVRWSSVFVVLAACGKSAVSLPAVGSDIGSGSGGSGSGSAVVVTAPPGPPPLVPEKLVDCTPQNWCRLPGPIPGDPITAMSSGSPNTFWAASASGLVVRYDAGALHYWFLDGLRPTDTWADGADAWVATDQGIAARYHDGTWSRIEVSPKENLRHVHGTHGDGPWFTTSYGKLVHLPASGAPTTLELPDKKRASAIWVAAPNDIWVVASSHFPDLSFVWRVMRWDGSAWRDMALPAKAMQASLSPGITGRSAADVWVSADSKTLHWDGTSWSAVSRGGSAAMSVAGSNDVILAGRGLFEMFDGTDWTRIEQSADGVVALGKHRFASGLVLYEGKKVTRLAAGAGIEAQAVWAGPDAIYEVGKSYTKDGGLGIARWDGLRWTHEDLEGSYGVAIGGIDTPWIIDLHGDVWHRDGTKWVRETPGGGTHAIAVVSADELFTADRGHTILHRVSGTWSTVPATDTTSISAIGAGAGQFFISRDRNNVHELARWDGKQLVTVATLPKPAQAIVARSATDVDLAISTSLYRWHDGILEERSAAGYIEAATSLGDTTYVLSNSQGKSSVGIATARGVEWQPVPWVSNGSITARDGHVFAMQRFSGDLRVLRVPKL